MNICTRHIAVIEAWHSMRTRNNGEKSNGDKINIKVQRVDVLSMSLCLHYDLLKYFIIATVDIVCNINIAEAEDTTSISKMLLFVFLPLLLQYHDYIFHQLNAIQDEFKKKKRIVFDVDFIDLSVSYYC